MRAFKKNITWILPSILFLAACHKQSVQNGSSVPATTSFSFNSLTVNGSFNGYNYTGVTRQPLISFSFSASLDRTTVPNAVTFSTAAGTSVSFTISYANHDSTIILQPAGILLPLTSYSVSVAPSLLSTQKSNLQSAVSINLLTAMDSSDKFPRISDSALLDLVQQQTFRYFWDFGHPVSGLARERNTSGDVVTTGGSGFGIMALVCAVSRNFISRADGLSRLQKMVDFLTTRAQRFHGAFPHWLNGSTGAVVPFSQKDDGADLVETSYLLEGLLTARQFFNNPGTAETAIRDSINSIWKNVEWSWFRKNNENVLYWHWSPDYDWAMNMPVHGWDEALITYVLAASSPAFPIPKSVYDNGWAMNGTIKNGNSYYGNVLPLGPAYGGPLFFSHYSFLGINPFGLQDAYANYETQVVNHTKINYAYCVNDPKGYYGYSSQCWGLTASDIPGGYSASSPTNDVGVIAPTAALSSIPFTPEMSLNALRFFYYTLGDKLWGDYGFYDAFSLQQPWFSNSYLAIDEGPIMVMTENYRSGLPWKLFMSCPEIKRGLTNLGFQSPNL